MGDDSLQIAHHGVYYTPKAMHVQDVADRWFLISSYLSAASTLRLLLLAGFCLLLICSPSFGQFTVSVEPSFTVEVEASKPAQRQWFLVSEPWCQHCPAAKERFLSLGWPKENILSLEQCEARFGFRPDHVPFEFGEPVAAVKPAEPAPTKPVPAVAEMSHSEMVALHNRLHGGGSWSWPGDLADHLRTTHGVSTSKPATTVRYQQSSCPGGRCPVPTQRRRGSFGGWFR